VIPSWYEREIWFVGVSYTLKNQTIFDVIDFGCPTYNQLSTYSTAVYAFFVYTV